MSEAIVLAGGFGTRLQQIVSDVPKPMAPIAGRPFLEILLSSVAKKGIARVVLSLGYMADIIINHFGNNFHGLDLSYVTEDAPLGTGGAVRLAMTRCKGDHVFVFNGDTFLDLEIQEIDQLWYRRHNPIIVGRQVPDVSRYGCLITDKDRVIGFAEKGMTGPGLVNAGSYVLNRGQLNHYPLKKAFSLESDYLSRAVTNEHIDLFVTHGHFIDIGVPDDFYRAQSELVGY